MYPQAHEAEVTEVTEDRGVAGAVRVDEGKICSHLDEVVRSTVEQTLNQMLDEEADRIAGPPLSGSGVTTPKPPTSERIRRRRRGRRTHVG